MSRARRKKEKDISYNGNNKMSEMEKGKRQSSETGIKISQKASGRIKK